MADSDETSLKDGAPGANANSETSGQPSDMADEGDAGVQDASVRPAEDTAHSAGGQAQQGVQGSPEEDPEAPEPRPTTVQGFVTRKQRNAHELLVEKELLKLEFIHNDAPYEYFMSWRDEANKAFSLLVRLRRRMEEEGLDPKGATAPFEVGKDQAG